MIMIEKGMRNMSKMKTLYERLKQEHKDALADEATRWPAIVESIVIELKENKVILDLSYGCVVTISHTLGLKNSNIDTIANLFEANELLNVNSK